MKYQSSIQNLNFTNGIKYYVILVFVLFITSCNNSSGYESQNESSDSTEVTVMAEEAVPAPMAEEAVPAPEEFTEEERQDGNDELAEQRAREEEYADESESNSEESESNEVGSAGLEKQMDEYANKFKNLTGIDVKADWTCTWCEKKCNYLHDKYHINYKNVIEYVSGVQIVSEPFCSKKCALKYRELED